MLLVSMLPCLTSLLLLMLPFALVIDYAGLPGGIAFVDDAVSVSEPLRASVLAVLVQVSLLTLLSISV